MTSPLPGWYPDPCDIGNQRYWDGREWTQSTTRALLPSHPPLKDQNFPEPQAGANPPYYLPYGNNDPQTQVRAHLNHKKAKSWGIGDMFFGFAAFIAGSVLLSLLVVVNYLYEDLYPGKTILSENAMSLLLIIGGVSISAASFIGTPLYATMKKGAKSIREDFKLAFKPVDIPLGAALAFVGLAVGAAVSATITVLTGEEVSNTQGIPTEFNGPKIVLFLIIVIAVAVVIPVAEEIFFRGLVLRAFEKKYSVAVGVIASSTIFGLVHPSGATNLAGVIAIPLVTGLYGLLFALAAVKTQRLGSPIVAHMLINFTATTVLFFT